MKSSFKFRFSHWLATVPVAVSISLFVAHTWAQVGQSKEGSQHTPLDVRPRVPESAEIHLRAGQLPEVTLTSSLIYRILAAEIAAQFEAFSATGLALDHVNAHKHFHLHPTIAALMLSIGRDFGLRAARVPLEPAATLAQIEPYKVSSVAALTRPFAQGLRRRFARAGIASPDAVFGLAWSGAMTTPRLRGILDHLPDGLSEI